MTRFSAAFRATAVTSICLIAGSVAIAEDLTAHSAPEDGGPRRWEVTQQTLLSHTKPDPESSTSAAFTKGAILSNMGCRQTDTRVWCSVRDFRGGPRGFVDRTGLKPALGPDGTTPIGPNESRKRASQKAFDAETKIACAQERGQALGQCRAAVARSTGGDATVVVTFPNGFARSLYFLHGEFVSASATMSGVGRDVDWTRDHETLRIRVDDQRFEMFDAFVFGD